MDKDSIIINNKNFSLEIKNNKLILFIRGSESFSFENVLDSACEKCKNPQDELYNAIQKQNDRYFINKPLQICADIKSSSDEESKQNDKESKRKIIYIQDELSFKNCVFSGEVRFEYICFAPLSSKAHNDSEAKHNEKNPNDFRQSTQPLRLDFQHCEFHKRVYFTNCEFNGNVFFNHAVFERYADFHESIFNGVVSFYNAEFKYAPNFSTCVFQNLQATNFINVKIDDIDFDKVNDFITEYKNDKMYEKELDLLREKYRAKTKKIKLLKTQCKQETNRYRENKQKLHSKKFQACKQEKIKKYKIRYASNARDSFRTIKNVLIANNNLLDASTWHKLELYAKEHELKLQKPCLLTTPKKWCDLWQLKFYRKTSTHHTNLLKIWHTLIVLNGVFGILFGLAFLFSNCQIDCIKCVDLCLNCYEYQCKNLYEIYNNFGKACINIILSLLFIVLFLCVVMRKISRIVFIAIGYVASGVILITNPKYLFPAVSLFEKSENFSHIATISAIYTFFFILVIFSLQKTARKNSIIPN